MGCSPSQPVSPPASETPFGSGPRPNRRKSFDDGNSFSRTIIFSTDDLLSETTIPDVDERRYALADSVWDALSGEHAVKPLRMTWLIQQKKLPRCQDLPAAAFIDCDELKKLFGEGNDGGNGDVLPLIAVSARDPSQPLDEAELAQLVAALAEMQPGCADVGYTEMGVVCPWGSFAQKGGLLSQRSAEEAASFEYAMHQTYDLWFAHRGISAVLLDDAPAGVLGGYRGAADPIDHATPASPAVLDGMVDAMPGAPNGASGASPGGSPAAHGCRSSSAVAASGWSAFARLLAEGGQKWSQWNAPWDMVRDLAAPAAAESSAARDEPPPEDVPRTLPPLPPRHWPVGADDFENLAPLLQFPCTDDCVLATALYKKASTSTLGTLKFLNLFDGLPTPCIAEAARLGKCLNYANQIGFLDFQGVDLDGPAISALFGPMRRAAMPALTALLLRGSQIGDTGVEALCLALRRERAMPKLKVLDLSGGDSDSDPPSGDGMITDKGVKFLSSTMTSGCLGMLARLSLHMQPRIGAAAVGHLEEAFLNGACGRLLSINLEGHTADEAAVQALTRVLRLRGIDSDLLAVDEPEDDPEPPPPKE